VDVELLDRLAPSVIVTQTQCEVCAVSLTDVEQAVCKLVSSRPDIVPLAPMDLEEVWTDITRVAKALGAPEQAERLVADLQGRLEKLRSASRNLGRRPSIACIEWIDPLMHAGNWLPALADIAGAEVLMGEAGRHSGYFDIAELVAHDRQGGDPMRIASIRRRASSGPGGFATSGASERI